MLRPPKLARGMCVVAKEGWGWRMPRHVRVVWEGVRTEGKGDKGDKGERGNKGDKGERGNKGDREIKV